MSYTHTSQHQSGGHWFHQQNPPQLPKSQRGAGPPAPILPGSDSSGEDIYWQIDMVERICDFAVHAQETFGWKEGEVVGSATSKDRIGGNLPTDADVNWPAGGEPDRGLAHQLHPRQGGEKLAEIWAAAGAKKPTGDRPKQISMYAAQSYLVGKKGFRNKEDIPSWCGIFVLWVYRQVLLRLPTWVDFDKEMRNQYFEKTLTPQRGDFGISNWNDGNHHFLVIGELGQTVETIEGNLNEKFTIKGQERYVQTIVRRTRNVQTINSDDDSAFYTPRWENL